MTVRLGSLFSGYGGLDLAVAEVLGAQTAWHCESDPDAARVLATRWPDVPNHEDITTVDWTTVEPVDVLAGGFPCQDLSSAGQQVGLGPGTRSGLWNQMAHAISVLGPRLVVIENVRGITSAKAHARTRAGSQPGAARELEPCPTCLGETGDVAGLRALGVVLGDLADLGYDTRWCGLRAADVGAPHSRFRIFIAARPAADTDGDHSGQPWTTFGVAEVRDQHPARAGQRAAPAPAAQRSTASKDTEASGRSEVSAAHTAPGSQPGSQPGLDASYGLGGYDLCAVWGPYAAAIGRWEQVTGRPAPEPTEPFEPGRNGQPPRNPRLNPRLNVRLVEWMMGLSAGYVTAVPDIKPRDQLRILGNGVVPQQAAHALRLLLST